MNKKFHKFALSAAAAVFTITTAVTTVSAAQKNRLVLSCGSDNAQAGDVITVDLRYIPDLAGAAGFTIDLCYDPDAVSLSIPADGGYVTAGGFSVVRNFTYSNGRVRLVGANMTGSNVTEETVLTELDFTVNDGYYGDIPFWTEVDSFVSFDGENYINADFNSSGPYTPFTVTGPSKPADSEETVTDAEQTVEQSAEQDVPQPEETASSDTQTLPETVLPPDTSADTEETQDTHEETEGQSETDGQQEVDGQQESDGQAATMFSHKQGNVDYNNETPVQYSFSPYDYLTEDASVVDISVSVNSTGTASGGIGMQTSEGWKIYNCSSDGSGEAVWTAESVDLSDVSGDIAVQLYYLKNNSEFEINSITAVPSAQSDTVTPTETGAPSEDKDSTEQTETNAPSEDNDSTEQTETDAPSEDNDGTEQTETDAPSEDNDSAEQTETAEPSDSETSDSETDPVTDTLSDTSSDVSSDISDSEPDNTQKPDNVQAVKPDNVQKPESEQAAAAEQLSGQMSAAANANPDTGSGLAPYVCGGVLILCAAQMIYSLFYVLKRGEK